jgi:hypothetical protein
MLQERPTIKIGNLYPIDTEAYHQWYEFTFKQPRWDGFTHVLIKGEQGYNPYMML